MAEVPWSNFAKNWLNATVACQEMALAHAKWLALEMLMFA